MTRDSKPIEWLGAIPTNWSAQAVKRGFDLQLGKMLQNDAAAPDDRLVPYFKAANVTKGIIGAQDLPQMWASSEDVRKYGVHPMDLLVCEGGDVGRSGVLDVAPPNAIIQNSVHRVRSKSSSDVRFLRYVLEAAGNAGWFSVLCNRATIAHFTTEKFSDLRIPFPLLNQQRRIADHLDRETIRIDDLVQKKRRQIELLQEKRVSFISQRVTRGANRNARLKHSGLAWLGDIPANWNIRRAKVLFREINERSGDGELLTVSHITGVTPRSEKDVTMFMAESLDEYKRCERDDLVINTMWAWMGALGMSPCAGIVSPSYNVYRFRGPGSEPRYYDLLFRTPEFVAEIGRYSKGIWSSRLRLYPEEFFEIRLPCPPMSEQRAIVAAIDKETGSFRTLQRKLEASIETLLEYRAALISSVVTGKLAVREEVSA